MNILVTENYNRKDIFEIVDEYPHGYIVWPIGRRNFPFTGYVPLAKPTDEPYHIDINTLKATRLMIMSLITFLMKLLEGWIKQSFTTLYQVLTGSLWTTLIYTRL